MRVYSCREPDAATDAWRWSDRQAWLKHTAKLELAGGASPLPPNRCQSQAASLQTQTLLQSGLLSHVFVFWCI